MDMRHELYGSQDEDGLVKSLWKPELRGSTESLQDAAGHIKLSMIAQCYERALSQAQPGDFELGMIAHLERRLIKSLALWAAPLPTELAMVMLPVTPQPDWFSAPRDAAPAQMNRAVMAGAGILKLRRPQAVALSLDLHKASLAYALQAAWYGQALHPVTGLEKLDAWLVEAETVAEEFSLPPAKATERLHRVRSVQAVLDESYMHSYSVVAGQRKIFERNLNEHVTEEEIRVILG